MKWSACHERGVPDRIRTYDLPNTGGCSIHLSYGELMESEAIYNFKTKLLPKILARASNIIPDGLGLSFEEHLLD